MNGYGIPDPMTYKWYLRDLGYLLREEAFEAKAKRDAARGTADESYAAGFLMGYFQVITWMQNEAWTFGIPFEDLCLDGIDPDQDLL